MKDALSISVNMKEDYEVAIEAITEALSTEGFGILTEVDVKDTLKTKIDVDFRRYVILGVCNPHLAHRALTEEPLMGLMLPCNITVEETEDGGALVNIVNPKYMLASSGIQTNHELEGVGLNAYEKLSKVAELIGNRG